MLAIATAFKRPASTILAAKSSNYAQCARALATVVIAMTRVGKNELGLDLCFNDFASCARQGNGKNAHFRLTCSTKTKVKNQALTEQKAWPAPKSNR